MWVLQSPYLGNLWDLGFGFQMQGCQARWLHYTPIVFMVAGTKTLASGGSDFVHGVVQPMNPWDQKSYW